MVNSNDPWIILFVFLACVVAPVLLVLGGGLLVGGLIAARRSASKSQDQLNTSAGKRLWPLSRPINWPPSLPPEPAAKSSNTGLGEPTLKRSPEQEPRPQEAKDVPAAPAAQTRPSPSSLPTARRNDPDPSSSTPTTRRAETPAAPADRPPQSPPPAALQPAQTQPASAAQAAPVGKKCPQCGKLNRPGARFCANCGRDLSAALAGQSPAPPAGQQPASPVHQPPAPPAGQVQPVAQPSPQAAQPDAFCWNCGQALRPSSRFCPSCGEPV